MSGNGPTKKRMFLHGQWVEVTVLPPQQAPEPRITAAPRHLSGTSVDETVYETKGSRRAKNRKPS